ncbi:MAG: glycosyltransferase family 2 protein [Candidatus Rokubacteria bacterium]|nr:glycosyltransferase family 2 protein [Candidatus Rokubacteria bacterium]
MSDHLILIPVFDEALTIEGVVTRARRHGAVLVIDDGSSDESAALAARGGADVLRLARRSGKGQALRRGFAEALARGADRVVTLDGDGQHDPDEIPRLLHAAASSPDAVVIGGRLGRGGAAANGVIPAGRLCAMRVAGFFIDWLTGCPLTDTQSGFRVYPVRLLETIAPRGGGFVLESEVLIRAAAGGWRLVETPVTARHFPARRSRFRPVRDGVAVGALLAGEILRRFWREAALGAAALRRPFTAARRRPRHRELAEITAFYRGNPGACATAVGLFFVHRTAATWRDWWGDPRARAFRAVGLAAALTPVLLALALLRPGLRRIGLDLLGPLVRAVYSQERLARALAPQVAAAEVVAWRER